MNLNTEDNFFYIKNNYLKNNLNVNKNLNKNLNENKNENKNLNENKNKNLNEILIENFAGGKALQKTFNVVDEIDASKIDAFKIALRTSDKFKSIADVVDKFDNEEIIKLMKKLNIEDQMKKLDAGSIPTIKSSNIEGKQLSEIGEEIQKFSKFSNIINDIKVPDFKKSVGDILKIDNSKVKKIIAKGKDIQNLTPDEFNSVVRIKRLVDANDPAIGDVDVRLRKLYEAGMTEEDLDKFLREHKFGADIQFKNTARKKYKDMKSQYQKKFCPVKRSCFNLDKIDFEKAQKSFGWSADDINYARFLKQFKDAFYKNVIDEVPINKFIRKHPYFFGIMGTLAILGVGLSAWIIAMKSATGGGACGKDSDCQKKLGNNGKCIKRDEDLTGTCKTGCRDDTICEKDGGKCNPKTNLCETACKVPKDKSSSSSCGDGQICIATDFKESFSSDTSNSPSDTSNSPAVPEKKSGFCKVLCGSGPTEDTKISDQKKCNDIGLNGYKCTKKEIDGKEVHTCEAKPVDPSTLPCSTDKVIFGIDLFKKTTLTCSAVNTIIISVLVVILLIFLFLIIKIIS